MRKNIPLIEAARKHYNNSNISDESKAKLAKCLRVLENLPIQVRQAEEKTKNIHLRLIAQYNRYSTLSKEMIHEKG